MNAELKFQRQKAVHGSFHVDMDASTSENICRHLGILQEVQFSTRSSMNVICSFISICI